MKRATLALLCVLALGAGTASSAWARHFHHGVHIGVYIGPSFGWGWYYPPPVYYYPYPLVVMAPAAPPVYIEQAPAAAQPEPQANYWYYCSNPDGYYPYIKQCPGGWKRVAPLPPAPPDR